MFLNEFPLFFSNKIPIKFTQISDFLKENFVDQVNENNIEMLKTYDVIQAGVVMLKVDMLQKLNISVDYVDADGD